MEYITEQATVIGDPSESFVAEAVWLCLEHDGWPVRPEDVVEALTDTGRVDRRSVADRLVWQAVDDDEIRVVIENDEPGHRFIYLCIDDITRLRITRRSCFWKLQDLGINPPAHLPSEGVIARAGIMEWNDNYEEPPCSADLVRTVRNLMGYSDDFYAVHVVLNALDCGAVLSFPEHVDDAPAFDSCIQRFYITDHWQETLDSSTTH